MARLFDDGSSEALSYSSALVAVRPLTMACWFYTDTIAITETLMAIFDSSETPAYDGFALDVSGTEAGDPVRAWCQQNSATIDIAKTTAGPSVNTWHHACGTFSASANKVYIDAGNSHSVGATVNPIGPDETCIGRRYYGSAYSAHWSGRVAEATIWDAVLTDAEVAVLATGIRPIMVRPQSIVAYWPLVRDQDYDLVGGYDMTPIGSPTVSAHPRVLYPAPVTSWPAPATAAIFGVRGIGRGILRGVGRGI